MHRCLDCGAPSIEDESSYCFMRGAYFAEAFFSFAQGAPGPTETPLQADPDVQECCCAAFLASRLSDVGA